VREYFADRPDDLLELCLDCDVEEANGGKDPESALRAFLGCPTSLKPFVRTNAAKPAWNHRFFSEEDLAAGITEWSRFPEPVFKAGARGPPQFPDLVTPLLEQMLAANATADSATPTHVGGEPRPQVRDAAVGSIVVLRHAPAISTASVGLARHTRLRLRRNELSESLIRHTGAQVTADQARFQSGGV